MTILFAWLWQGLAVAALTGIALRAIPRLNAATRHLTWWVALIAVISIPLLLVAVASLDTIPGPVSAPGESPVQPAVVLPVPDWMGLLVASIWAAAAAFGLARLTHGCKAVRALRRASVPFDRVREARLPLWSDAANRASRRAELRVSDDFAGACALGFRRPAILIGRHLADALDDAALDQIVMHEQAHLTAYDDWLLLLQALIRSLGGLHPAVWWVSRRIDVDREAACDDAVVAHTGETRRYAAALLDAAAATGGRSTVLAMVPGATARASALRVRVARLLDPRRARDVRPTPLAALVLVLPLGATLASPHLAPVVTFVEAVEHALPLPARAARYRERPAMAPSISDRTRILLPGLVPPRGETIAIPRTAGVADAAARDKAIEPLVRYRSRSSRRRPSPIHPRRIGSRRTRH